MATCRRAGARQKGDNRKNTEIKEEPPPQSKEPREGNENVLKHYLSLTREGVA